MREIMIMRGKEDSGYRALVDDEDFFELTKYRWGLQKNKKKCYAVAKPTINGVCKTIYMHRMLLNAERGEEVDHKDGNGLNNQKYNLRKCTKRENSLNQRKRVGKDYIGVYFREDIGKWGAVCRKDGKSIFSVFHMAVLELARTYDCMKRILFGESEFSSYNFPEETFESKWEKVSEKSKNKIISQLKRYEMYTNEIKLLVGGD